MDNKGKLFFKHKLAVINFIYLGLLRPRRQREPGPLLLLSPSQFSFEFCPPTLKTFFVS
jgi:hypothetical protein